MRIVLLDSVQQKMGNKNPVSQVKVRKKPEPDQVDWHLVNPVKWVKNILLVCRCPPKSPCVTQATANSKGRVRQDTRTPSVTRRVNAVEKGNTKHAQQITGMEQEEEDKLIPN